MVGHGANRSQKDLRTPQARTTLGSFQQSTKSIEERLGEPPARLKGPGYRRLHQKERSWPGRTIPSAPTSYSPERVCASANPGPTKGSETGCEIDVRHVLEAFDCFGGLHAGRWARFRDSTDAHEEGRPTLTSPRTQILRYSAEAYQAWEEASPSQCCNPASLRLCGTARCPGMFRGWLMGGRQFTSQCASMKCSAAGNRANIPPTTCPSFMQFDFVTEAQARGKRHVDGNVLTTAADHILTLTFPDRISARLRFWASHCLSVHLPLHLHHNKIPLYPPATYTEAEWVASSCAASRCVTWQSILSGPATSWRPTGASTQTEPPRSFEHRPAPQAPPQRRRNPGGAGGSQSQRRFVEFCGRSTSPGGESRHADSLAKDG